MKPLEGASGLVPVPDAPAKPQRRSEFRLPEDAAHRVDLWWCVGVLVGIAVLFIALKLAPGASVPLFLAWVGAYSLNPLVTELEARKVPRVVGTIAVLGAMLVGMAGALLYVVPVLRDEVLKLPGFLRDGIQTVLPRLEASLGLDVPEFVRDRVDAIRADLISVFEKAGPLAAQVLTKVAENTARWLGALIGLAVVPVLLFLFLLDFPGIHEKALTIAVPRHAAGLVARRFGDVNEVLSAFVRGQLLVGSILSVIYSVGLGIARIDLAIVIGIIAGFGNMVPYLGTGIGIVLAILGTLLAWQGPWQIVVVALTFIIGQMLEGFVITPRVVGDRVGLSAATIIIAILIFSELFGFLGILLAVPVSAILKVVVQVAVDRYHASAVYRGVPPNR